MELIDVAMQGAALNAFMAEAVALDEASAAVEELIRGML